MRRLLLGLVLLIACSPGGDGDGDGGSPFGAGSGASPPGVANPHAPVDEDAFTLYARDTCEYLFRCQPPVYPDREACVDAQVCTLRSVLAGSTLTRGELLSCSRPIRDAACGAPPIMLPDACAAYLGALASVVGEDFGCGGEMCGTGDYCDRSDPHCERCARRAALGESCAATRCASDAVCTVPAFVCQAPVGEGMPCESITECAQPDFGTDGWLTCRGGVCRKSSVTGESCDHAGHCAPYLRCVEGVCRDRAELGEACAGHGDCYPYTLCIQGACTQVCGLQRAGGLCIGDLFCIDSFCDAASSRCVALKGVGAACERSEQCAEELFCDGASASCVARVADGAACTLHDECLSELCENQSCVQPVCQP